jgi:N-acyl-D-amino-acid deacylase
LLSRWSDGSAALRVIDLLIKNGLILDGTGNPGFSGALAVQDERLALVRGETSGIRAARTIDAHGKVVAPGFIDLHSHAALTILGSPHHDPKVRQGVTTELVGVDGISHAPFRSAADRDRYIWLDSGLNGYPPEAKWLSASELLDQYDHTVAINVALIIGNGPLRVWSCGWTSGPATPQALDEMSGVLRESMEDGAWGLSTGLDYPPSSFADIDELVGLSRIAASHNGFYHTHTRRREPHPQTLLAPFEEAVEVGRRADIPIHLTHYMQRRQGEGSHLDYLALVENARAEGLDITFDCYSYPYGSTTLAIELPHWTKDGGPERVIEALTDSADRRRVAEDLVSRPDWGRLIANNWLTNFSRPENRRFEGMSIEAIARIRQETEVDTLLNLLLEENLGVTTVSSSANAATLPAFVSHPLGMIASDAILLGETPNPRTYGCFPLVLAEYVRAEKHLRLPEAIRKMTSFPAQRLGLTDRGVIRDGSYADLVIFDPQTIRTPATKEDPKRYPEGIDYVIVNGTIVIDHGDNTGELPGHAIRRSK